MKYEYDLIKRIKFTFNDKKVMEQFLKDLWSMGMRFSDRRKTIKSVVSKDDFENIYIMNGEIYTNITIQKKSINIEDFLEKYEHKKVIHDTEIELNKTIDAFFKGKIVIRCDERWESKRLREILKKKRVYWRSGNRVSEKWTPYLPIVLRYDTSSDALCYASSQELEGDRKIIQFKELLDWRNYFEN